MDQVAFVAVAFSSKVQASRRHVQFTRSPWKKAVVSSKASRIHMSTETQLSPVEIKELAKEHSNFIREKCAADQPDNMIGLLTALMLNGDQLVTEPGKSEFDHPLLIPLARDPSDGQVSAGLLRWPTPPSGMSMPIVAASSKDKLQLTLLANSSSHFIHRQLAAHDFQEYKDQFKQLYQVVPQTLYTPGAVIKLGMGLHKYLLLKVGPFVDAYQALSRAHLKNGDIQSALITCEKASTSFPGWSHSHAFHARLLKEIGGRDLESRDAARFAIHLPLWTMDDDLFEIAAIAGYQDPKNSLGPMFRGLSKDPRDADVQEGKAIEQVALDRAAYVLDRVVAEQAPNGWNSSVKQELAELYEMSRLPEVARFISL